MAIFAKREHIVNDIRLAKDFLLENDIKEEDITMEADCIKFNVVGGTLEVNKNDSIFFEGAFDDGETDIWVKSK